MIDTDTRQLKRTAEGHYISGAGKRPCDHCGHNEVCSMRVKACSEFLPALPFTDETGMRKVFNTVRIGSAWPKRLEIGQAVALYNPTKKEIFGHAKVLSTFVGPIRDMLNTHAHANHLMLSEHCEEAPGILHSWLRQNYGPRIVHETTRLTAIYLLRERVTPAAPDLRRDEADGEAEGGAEGHR